MKEREQRETSAVVLEKASKAKDFLANPVIADAFERLDAEYSRNWRASDPQQAEIREEFYFRLLALDAVRQDIQSIIDDGRIAESSLRRLK